MKKLYFLFTLLITALSLGQTTIFQESFETYTNGITYTTSQPEFSDGGGDFFGRTNLNDTAEDVNDLTVGTYYTLNNTDGDFCFAAMDLDAANTTGSGGATSQTILFDDISINGYSNLTLAMLLAEDKDGTNFDWDGGDLFYIEVDYDNSGSFTKIFQVATNATTGANVSDPMIDSDLDGIGDGATITDIFTEFTVPLTSGNTVDIRITFLGLNAGDEDLAIDNIRIIDNFVSTPSLTITSPSNGSLLNPLTTSVDVAFTVANFAVANGTGDGYISYSINGGTAIDQFDTSNITIPVTPGQSYSVAMELVDNSGNPLSTPITDNVVFSVDIIYVMTDIAALRADVITNGYGRYYQINSTPTITYRRDNRNQKYIQDATAAIVIDDNAGIITVGVDGDNLSGLVGQSYDFFGLLEFVPVQDASVVSSGNTVTPQIVTIADVTATPEAYESELLQIDGVSFDATNTTFATNTNVPVTAPTATTFRPIFSEADYIGQNIPTSATNIICFAGQSTPANVPTTNQVYLVARTLQDLTLSTRSFDAIEGLTMYPNPLSGNTLNFSSTTNAAMTIQIYNILGKEVAKGNVINNTFNTGNLNAGVYIVKVTEEGKTATRKLVVR